jgi:stage II sporulation protein P
VLSNCLFNNIDHDYIFIENPIYNFTIDRDSLLVKLGLNYEYIDDITSSYVFNEITVKPKIYLYNSHQSEEYDSYTLIDATNYLKSELESMNIDVEIDDVDIESIIVSNNLQYKDSYKVTRSLIENRNIDSFGILIDLHRDSSKRSVTTATINNINYAKVMFVVGGNHDNYKYNYELMDDLNKRIKSINSNLSRGIFLRRTSNYNQDLDSKIILIELGGIENTKEEVNNTIKILSKVLADYLNE